MSANRPPRAHLPAAACAIAALVSLVLLPSCSRPPLAAPEALRPSYSLGLWCTPSEQRIEVDVRLRIPAALVKRDRLAFVLNQRFEITIAELDGAAVTPRLQPDATPPMFHSESAQYVVEVGDESAARELRLRYQGRLPGPNEGGGAIEEHLVELALYRTWFPEIVGATGLSYTMTAHLPTGFRAVANGVPTSVSEEGADELVFAWSNQDTGFHDINLVGSASPKWPEPSDAAAFAAPRRRTDGPSPTQCAAIGMRARSSTTAAPGSS